MLSPVIYMLGFSMVDMVSRLKRVGNQASETSFSLLAVLHLPLYSNDLLQIDAIGK